MIAGMEAIADSAEHGLPRARWDGRLVPAPIAFVGQLLSRIPQKIQSRHAPLAALPVPHCVSEHSEGDRLTHNGQ